jgi:type IV secretory pathway protease TraF
VGVGTLVVLPVPVSMRPWHSRWLPLLKPVAAVAGDQVCAEGIFLLVRSKVGDEWYAEVYREAHGHRLPQLLADGACLTVEDGTVFLASKTRRSLDGRYFGLTPIATLTAVARPLLTWR